jgi:hypothetical protein
LLPLLLLQAATPATSASATMILNTVPGKAFPFTVLRLSPP